MVKMEAVRERLGKCEVCDDREAKYKCPKCEVKTCCLHCVNIHKRELQCDGIRKKIAFKRINAFTNLDLLSDYRLLEEVGRSVDSYVRDPLKNYTRQFKKLPLHLYKLRCAAANRNTQLLFLPGNFSRHKENTTYFNWNTQVIQWKVEWIFPHCETKYIDDRIDESNTLNVLLDRLLDPDQCPWSLREPLKFYQSAGHNGISLLLKAEKMIKANLKYHLLDPSMTLQEVLKGKAIIEFPTIIVILNDHKDAYELLDSDEEMENDIQVNKALQDLSSKNSRGNIRMNNPAKRKSTNFLFHDFDCSSEESDGEDKVKTSSKIKEAKYSSRGDELQANNQHFCENKLKSNLAEVHSEVQSDGRLPSAAKLLSGFGQLDIPPYDVLIKLPS